MAVLVIAVVKPWGPGLPAGGPAQPTTTPPPTAAFAAPSGAAAERGGAPSRYCEFASGWRIASIERSGSAEWRAWKAIEPAVGQRRGPSDAAIPFVEVIAERVPALGYCAPAEGSDRPDGEARMFAWNLAGAGEIKRLSLRELDTSAPTILGALFSPPTEGDGWPAGRYVFRVGDRWLGVEVRLVVAREAGSASASPSHAGPSASRRP